VCAVGIFLLSALIPANSADRAREIAAHSLLAEGEKLNEATQPAAALEIFERVAKEYPDTEAGMFAQFRRAETLVFLDRCTEAIARAQMVIDAYPNTVVAAWSQYAIGQALLKQQGRPDDAVQAFRKVKGMLPNKLDLGALEGSRVVLAQLMQQHYGFSEKTDPLAMASFLGVDRNDAKSKAELYAILAFHWGRAGRIDLANPVLARLSQECPEESDELEWAKSEVGIGYLNVHNEGDEFCKLAIELLKPVLSSGVPNDESAKAALCLARFYKRSGKYAESAGLLEGAIAKHIETAHASEMLYELATVLRKQAKNDEAIKVLNRIVTEKPVSRYRLAAERLIEEIGKSTPETQASLDELIKEADARFDPKWKDLASAPKDGSLGDGVMVARQAVALAREDKPELALVLLDRFATQHKLSADELARAKAEMALCSLRAAKNIRRFSNEGALVFSICVGKQNRSAIETRVRTDLIRRAVSVIENLLHLLTSETDKIVACKWIAELAYGAGLYQEALHFFKEVIKSKTTRSGLAEAHYYAGMCYWHLQQPRVARQHMERIVELYPSSAWAPRARGLLYQWSAPQNIGANAEQETQPPSMSE